MLSTFVSVGVYWNNHHHMLHAATRVGGGVLGANLDLLFWLSLLPFVSGWMGENHFSAMPTALYGCVLLIAAIAYWILQRSITTEGRDDVLARAIGKDRKRNVSVLVYAAAIPVAFFSHRLSQACYVAVALLWLVPDRRIERALSEHDR